MLEHIRPVLSTQMKFQQGAVLRTLSPIMETEERRVLEAYHPLAKSSTSIDRNEDVEVVVFSRRKQKLGLLAP